MIRVALFGVVIVILMGADSYRGGSADAETPNEIPAGPPDRRGRPSFAQAAAQAAN